MSLGVSYLTLVSQHFLQDRHITADDTTSRKGLTLQGCTNVDARTETVARLSAQHFTSPQASPGSHLARLVPHRKSCRCSNADLAVRAYGKMDQTTVGISVRTYRETYIIVRTSVTSHIIIIVIIVIVPAETLMCVRQMESPNYLSQLGQACSGANRLRGFP